MTRSVLFAPELMPSQQCQVFFLATRDRFAKIIGRGRNAALLAPVRRWLSGTVFGDRCGMRDSFERYNVIAAFPDLAGARRAIGALGA